MVSAASGAVHAGHARATRQGDSRAAAVTHARWTPDTGRNVRPDRTGYGTTDLPSWGSALRGAVSNTTAQPLATPYRHAPIYQHQPKTQGRR